MLRTAALAFVLALTGAIVPGPVLALVIGQVLALGVAAAAYVLVGHALLELVLVTALAAGAARWFRSGRVRGAVSILGGLVLVAMGQDMLRHAGAVTVTTAAGAGLPWYALVAAGAGVSLSNPYFTGWWATVGSGQVAALGLRRLSDYVAFFLGHEMGDVAWYMLVAVLLATGKGFLSDSVYRALMYACGAILLALGVWFLLVAVRTIRVQADEPSPAAGD